MSDKVPTWWDILGWCDFDISFGVELSLGDLFGQASLALQAKTPNAPQTRKPEPWPLYPAGKAWLEGN